MNIARMALKNLFRYKRRTFITVIAIGIALTFYIYMDSLMEGWYSGTEREYIDYEVADGRIVRSDWWADKDRYPLSMSIENPEEIATDFMAAMRSENGFLYLFLFIIAIISAVGVSNTMMMAVFERRREIGMMRAQGLSEVKIAWMFFFEAMGIGVFGAIVGLSLGALANIQMVYFGIDYGAMIRTSGDVLDFGGIAFSSVLKGVWNPKAFIAGGVFSIVISFLAAIAPTIRMLKKSIPDNLRTN